MLHAKLADDHAATVKQHDIELGTAKRSMVLAESERSALQRKIDDLAGQNQELARAFSGQRGRAMDRDSTGGQSGDDDNDGAADNATPEHSPPPSPIKGNPAPLHARDRDAEDVAAARPAHHPEPAHQHPPREDGTSSS